MPRQRPVYDKVKAATYGGGGATAVLILAMYALEKAGWVMGMPLEVRGAVELILTIVVGAVVAAAGAFLAGYQQRETKG